MPYINVVKNMDAILKNEITENTYVQIFFSSTKDIHSGYGYP